MAVKKRWYISFSSTESSKALNLSVSRKLGISLSILVSIFMLLFIGSLIYTIHNQNKILEVHKIIKENQVLKEKIISFSSEIDSILIKLKLMEEWEDEIRIDKNLKTINKEVRDMGIGGIPQVDESFSFFETELHLNYNLALNKLNQLKSKVNFDHETHLELLDQVKLKELLYQNTPSIYPAYGRISDGYGWRIHPITKKKVFHRGLDFGNKIGTPVYATADGKVKSIKKKKYMGKLIVVSHKFGYQTRYGHLYKIYVKEGDLVKRGQIIALLGNSGRSTGPHLHYEILRYNKHRNPYNYLNKLEDDIILSSE
jgi:murein DD-endopeptidase MepM/ murein hydrolase activator NlpD